MQNKIIAVVVVLIIVLSALFSGCNKSDNGNNYKYTHIGDTLRVGTLYSPTSYFIYKGEEMGYEFETMQGLLAEHGIHPMIKVAHSIDSMIAMLDDGRIDIIAYEIPITAEYKNRVLHCGIENVTHQVLVQPKTGDSLITDVIGLIGKDVFVEQNSKYEYRLNNLNNEIGGGVNIHPISQDSLITEDLIEMVSKGEAPLTIVDSDIARLNRTYYDNIDISLPVSFPQKSSWAVNKHNTILADSINSWIKSTDSETTAKSLLKRYFEISKNNPVMQWGKMFDVKNGRISPYDKYFKQYAKEIDYDWRLLAAQGYTESHFDTTVVSWAGARGVMQLLPGTAEALGVPASEITNPEQNIKAATILIKSLDKSLSRYISDKDERIKFILASYNAGLGHVIDAIELAKKHGKNPEKWEDNVEITIQMKANPEYFNDEVCRFGYFKGKQTIEYVSEVQKVYDIYKHKIKED